MKDFERLSEKAVCPHCGKKFAAVLVRNVRLTCPKCRQPYVFLETAAGAVTERREPAGATTQIG